MYKMQVFKGRGVLPAASLHVSLCWAALGFSDLAWSVVAHSENWSLCGMEKSIDDTTLLFLVLNNLIWLPYSRAWGGGECFRQFTFCCSLV